MRHTKSQTIHSEVSLATRALRRSQKTCAKSAMESHSAQLANLPSCQLASRFPGLPLALPWSFCLYLSIYDYLLLPLLSSLPNSPTRSAETLVSGVAPKSNESPHFGHDLLFACAIAARTRTTPVLCPLYSVRCRTPSCASVWLGRACECNVNDTQMGHTPPRNGLQFMAEWQMPNGQNCSQLMHTHSTTHTHSPTYTDTYNLISL